MSPLQSLHTYTAAPSAPLFHSPPFFYSICDTHAQTMRRNFSYYGMLKAKCNFLWQNTKLIPTHTHTLAHMETLLQQGLKLAKGFVCVCVCWGSRQTATSPSTRNRNRTWTRSWSWLRYVQRRGVVWIGVLKQTVASEASPVSQFAAAQHLTSLGICGARLRVKALPASWHLMSVA